MVALLSNRPKHMSEEIPYEFFFSYDEMKELLASVWFGKRSQEGFASRLDRLDSQDKLQKDKAKPVCPEDRKYGNSLLGRFTHKQVLTALRHMNTDYQEQNPEWYWGWPEYCLKVWVGKINPARKKYQYMPPVEDKDIYDSAVLLGKYLEKQLKAIDFSTEYKLKGLKSLFNQLKK